MSESYISAVQLIETMVANQNKVLDELGSIQTELIGSQRLVIDLLKQLLEAKDERLKKIHVTVKESVVGRRL